MNVRCDVCSAVLPEERAWTYYTTLDKYEISATVRERRIERFGLDATEAEFIYSQLMVRSLNKRYTNDPSWAVCPDCHQILDGDGEVEPLMLRHARNNRVYGSPASHELIQRTMNEITKGLIYFWFWRTDRVDPPATRNSG